VAAGHHVNVTASYDVNVASLFVNGQVNQIEKLFLLFVLELETPEY